MLLVVEHTNCALRNESIAVCVDQTIHTFTYDSYLYIVIIYMK